MDSPERLNLTSEPHPNYAIPDLKTPVGTTAINTAAIAQRLSQLSNILSAAPAASVTGAVTTLQLLKQPTMLSAAKKDAALSSQIASITKLTQTSLSDAQTKQAEYQKAIATMLQSAMALLKP